MNLESQKRALEKTGWNRGKSLANIPPIVLNKALKEITGDLRARHAHLSFGLQVREEAPLLAAMLHESTLLYSGAIHDLRNALIAIHTLSLNLQETTPTDLSDIISEIEYAILLFESLTELRLKDGWNPFLYPVWGKQEEHLIAMLEKALALGRTGCPGCTLSMQPFETEMLEQLQTRHILGDKRQITHAIAGVLWAVTHIDARAAIEIEVRHQGSGLSMLMRSSDWTPRFLETLYSLRGAEEGELVSLFLLASHRIALRHGGRLSIEDNAFVLVWPYFEPDTVEALVDDLTPINTSLELALENLAPLTTGVPVTKLMALPALTLSQALDHLETRLQQPGLERVLIKARYAQLIARNMLMASAGLQPQKVAFPLAPLLDDLTQSLSDFLEDCEVSVEIPSDLPDLFGDKTAIIQILVNLITNAVEAMDGEGTLSLQAEPHPAGVILQISDKGRGIPSQQLQHIFDLFHTTKKGQERGVGLHVVKTLVEQMNGSIEVMSEVGHGTTFTLTLPTFNPKAGAKAQVLIVEDEAIFLEDYERQLSEDQHLYILHTAKSVKAAREKYTLIHFDVVIADLKLRTRERGGLEILEEVKRLSPETQVFILTGQGETDDAREAERLGVERYLTKPVEASLLRSIIRSALRTGNTNETPGASLPTPIVMQYNCQVMVDLVNHAATIARASQHVLILGEAGTGKGLLAEGIHMASGRAHFDLVNCASLSEMTLGRILFGAENDEEGLFDRLNNGTLALDRVSGLSLRLQEHLLQKLSEKQDAADIRIIAMDHHDLEQAVRQGLFLPGLYALFQQATLSVPALRERTDGKYQDVLILADHFIEKYTLPGNPEPRLSPQVEYLFTQYTFPGNVAELEQVIRLALANLQGDMIQLAHLPPTLRRYGTRTTLGTSSTQAQVLCPHKPVLCNQVEAIQHAFQQEDGVYLHLSDNVLQAVFYALSEKCRQLKLSLFQPEVLIDALTTMCSVCVPVQACHYAIIELSQTPLPLYEVGLLHALGIPTLLLTHTNDSIPLDTAVTTYTDVMDIPQIIYTWLLQQRHNG